MFFICCVSRAGRYFAYDIGSLMWVDDTDIALGMLARGEVVEFTDEMDVDFVPPIPAVPAEAVAVPTAPEPRRPGRPRKT